MKMLRCRLIQLCVVLLIPAMQGCANLDAVRAFGKAAAEVSAYPDAGKAITDSASVTLPYRTIEVAAADTPAARMAQVKKVMALHATLSAYFSTLAKLAGEDAFSLDKELDSIGKGLQGLPGSASDAEITSAIGLVKIVTKYVLLAAQEKAVRDLVDEGGPPAMDILNYLEQINANWRSMISNDSRTVGDALAGLVQAKDAPILAVLLAKERLAQANANALNVDKRMETVGAALERIKVAHALMEKNRHALTNAELRSALQEAVADLKSAQALVASLH